MITIDSQIWIYYFDPNAKENKNVLHWMRKHLQTSDILLNIIIPTEVAHNLYTIPKISRNLIEQLLFKWITQKNITIADLSNKEMINALQKLKTLRSHGIGGRDCLILATMDFFEVKTIVTNDKNLLIQTDLQRINPIFDPPLILERGESFNLQRYKENLKSLYL